MRTVVRRGLGGGSVLLAGCQSGTQTAKKDDPVEKPSSAGDLAPRLTPEDIDKFRNGIQEGQEGVFDVKPGEEMGYKPAAAPEHLPY